MTTGLDSLGYTKHTAYSGYMVAHKGSTRRIRNFDVAPGGKKGTKEANSIVKRNRAVESSNTQSTDRNLKKTPLPRRFHWSIRGWHHAHSRRSHPQSIICRFAVVFLSPCYIHASRPQSSASAKEKSGGTRIRHIIPA